MNRGDRLWVRESAADGWREAMYEFRCVDQEPFGHHSVMLRDGGGRRVVCGCNTSTVKPALAHIEREAEPKWVLASVELPDSDVRVLVRGTDGDIVSAELEFTDDSEGHGEPYWASEGSDLTLRGYPHWMSRPADPPPGGASDV